MKRIADWSAAIAALLAAFIAVTVTTTDSRLSLIQGNTVTNRADWFAAVRARDGMPDERAVAGRQAEEMNR